MKGINCLVGVSLGLSLHQVVCVPFFQARGWLQESQRRGVNPGVRVTERRH